MREINGTRCQMSLAQAKHLRVRCNSSSAQDDEHAALPKLDDDESKLGLPLDPPSFLNAATAEPDKLLAEDEEVCRDEIMDMGFWKRDERMVVISSRAQERNSLECAHQR